MARAQIERDDLQIEAAFLRLAQQMARNIAVAGSDVQKRRARQILAFDHVPDRVAERARAAQKTVDARDVGERFSHFGQTSASFIEQFGAVGLRNVPQFLAHDSSHFFSTKAAFLEPKPRQLQSATRIFAARGAVGT